MTIDAEKQRIKMSSELFDLFVAAVNLLESKDISTTALFDNVMNDEANSQDILDYIISELEDLSITKMMNEHFAFDDNMPDNHIKKVIIAGGNKTTGCI